MTVSELKRRSLSALKDINLFNTVYDFSDCVYNAIVEMQTEALCSKNRLRKFVVSDGGVLSVGSIVGGTGYASSFQVTFTGDGNGAIGVAVATGGVITAVYITNSGKGYTTATPVFSAGGGSGASAVATLATQSFETKITPVFTGVSAGQISVEPIYIDALFKVGSDGGLTPILLLGDYDIQTEKDLLLNYGNSADLRASVTFSGDGMVIRTPWDMNGSLLEAWTRFKIPYTGDANAITKNNTSPDLYLETIPVQLQMYLDYGVRCHAYERMYELSGGDPKYQNLQLESRMKWYDNVLPLVRAKVNMSKSAETVTFVKPSQVFDGT